MYDKIKTIQDTKLQLFNIIKDESKPILFNIAKPEYWIDINSRINVIKPYYKISSYGRIYNMEKNIYMRMRIIGHGYLEITLQTINGPKDYLVHRLVKFCFNPIENSQLYQINHIDGNKFNNNICNLEWCTMEYNLWHQNNIIDSNNSISPFPNLISNISDRQSYHIYDHELVRKICECLTTTMSYREICDKNNIEYNDKTLSLIIAIKNRVRFKEISKDYVFEKNNKASGERSFTDEQARNICEMIIKGYDNRTICINIGFDLDNMDRIKRKMLYNKIRKIRLRKTYADISKDYKF